MASKNDKVSPSPRDKSSSGKNFHAHGLKALCEDTSSAHVASVNPSTLIPQISNKRRKIFTPMGLEEATLPSKIICVPGTQLVP